MIGFAALTALGAVVAIVALVARTGHLTFEERARVASTETDDED